MVKIRGIACTQLNEDARGEPEVSKKQVGSQLTHNQAKKTLTQLI